MDVTNSAKEAVVLGQQLTGKDFAINSDAAFFDILSNSLYSNPVLAVIRETITNADDANLEANSAEPVKITIDEEEREFIVTNIGKSIPHAQMHKIYCTYGNSTKKNTNSTGGFGLGCKSPFAITPVFTVINCNEGVKNTYLLNKIEGIPKITTLLSENCANDPDSLTVKIPLKDIKQSLDIFTERVKSFVYLAGIKATLNGELLPRINYPENQEVIYLTAPTRGGSSRQPNVAKAAHIGLEMNSFSYTPRNILVKYGSNIYKVNLSPYIKDSETINKYPTIHKFVYTADSLNNGDKGGEISSLWVDGFPIFIAEPNSLDITPSREELRLTEKTINSLTKICENEIKRLSIEPTIEKIKDLFMNRRAEFFAGSDRVIERSQSKGYVLAEDFVSAKYSYGGTFYKQQLKDQTFTRFIKGEGLTTGLFNKYEVELLDTVLNLLDPNDFGGSTKVFKGITHSEAHKNALLKALVSADREINSIAAKQGLSVFNPLYIADAPNGIFVQGEFAYTGVTVKDFLRRLKKIVIVSSYKNTDSQHCRNVIRNVFPHLSANTLGGYSYSITTKSAKKAAALKEELEKIGWFVVDLVTAKKGITPTDTPTQIALDLINNLKNKEQAYYMDEKVDAFLEQESFTTSATALTTFNTHNYYTFGKFNIKDIDCLTKLISFERIPMQNKRVTNIFTKHQLKSASDILAEDLKAITSGDKDINYICNLFSELGEQLFYCRETTQATLWFTLQIPELCERYGLPVINESQLRKISVLRSYIKTHGNDSGFIIEDETAVARVKEIADNIKEMRDFFDDIDYILRFLRSSLVIIASGQKKVPERLEPALESILDMVFLPKENTNQGAANE